MHSKMGKQGGKAVNKEVSFYKAGSFNPLWHTFFKVIPYGTLIKVL